ncbi:hypothetical protein ACQ4PT_017523 [Festuca glaucescens]
MAIAEPGEIDDDDAAIEQYKKAFNKPLRSENFRVISVYGPQLEPDKLQFLTDLEPMLLSSSPCCLMGDFNLIVSAAEKSSNNLNRRTMAAFRRFINKGELQELYLHGRRFTWSNEQADAIMVKLDRALHNAEWNSAFSNCLLQALSSDVSDHCPLLFTSQAGFKPCRRFRFENSWVKLDGFHEQVLASWNAPLFCYDAFERLRIKFARTAKGLAKWSGKLIGNLQLRALISSDLIQRLDEAMDCRRLTTDESQFRSFLKMNLLGISALQRSFWRQRSRVQWIREGDANTNFFHLKASARRRKNHITHVMHDGIPVAYQQAKLDIFQTFFEDLLGTNHPRSAALNFSELGVEQLDLQEMDSPFSEDEVKAAIFELHPSKAPGPDGYTACFYRHCWGIIKSDVMEAFKQFEMMACNKLHLLNEATLILIPKKPDASEPKDFRPISLVCSFSKLLLKVLARRLQPRMAELVRPCQSAFVRGRTIHDNFTYIRGLARIFTQKKIPALFLKLDLQKAFDSISWPFLIEVLRAKGFSDKFCNWICWMLASGSSKILLNGDLSEEICHRRGLRQGDPISPLLFATAMDCLAACLAAAETAGLLTTIGRQRMVFRASFYADDVAMFINPVAHEVAAVREILLLFGHASGLHTNIAKSTCIPIRCDGIDLDSVLAHFECPVSAFPCTFLGMPLSGSKLKRIDYQPCFDKLGKKIGGWKLPQSTGGRLTLVTSVLTAMPVFQMIALDQPKWLTHKVNKLIRDFLWACKDEGSGGKCLVNWSLVSSPKRLGGLGITNMQFHGTALRVRWLWQSWMDPSKPWLGLPLSVDTQVRHLFEASMSIILGDGATASFWNDAWLLDQPFRSAFPDLFAVCTKRALSVKDAIADEKWCRHFKRFLPTPAIMQFTVLWEVVQSVQLQDGVRDSLVWALVLNQCNMLTNANLAGATSFADWWTEQVIGLNKDSRHRTNSFVTIVSWEIWKERNNRIFNQRAVPAARVFENIVETASDWCAAGKILVNDLLRRPREPD